MEAIILNQQNVWKPDELFITKCDIRIGSILEYGRERFEVLDIPVTMDGNPICRLDTGIVNPIRGSKIKIVKI